MRISHVHQEGVMQVSKWLKIQVLLSPPEMRALFATIPNALLYNVSQPTRLEATSQAEFLDAYETYVTQLQEGKIVYDRSLFSSALSVTSDCFYAMEVAPARYLIRPIRPVVQMQAHHFIFSMLDEKFHPMVMGKESVSWGVQFSYPQLYQLGSGAYSKVDETFVNSILFKKISRWIREYTLPTPFRIGERRVNVPIRTGKECFSWIGSHFQLAARGLSI